MHMALILYFTINHELASSLFMSFVTAHMALELHRFSMRVLIIETNHDLASSKLSMRFMSLLSRSYESTKTHKSNACFIVVHELCVHMALINGFTIHYERNS